MDMKKYMTFEATLETFEGEDDRVYCIASEEIFRDDDGYWVKEKGNNAKWIEVNGLPKLLRSSLAEKVTYDEPIYLKDVIK